MENNEETIKKTWLEIEKKARKSAHLADENGVSHSPYPKTWVEAENDAVELAKLEHSKEWRQYKKLEGK